MAIALAFRVAIALAPHGVRVLKWAEGSGPGTAIEAGTGLWHRLTDPDESDEDLSAALSAAAGTVATVTTYASPFELRKLQVLWGRDSGNPAGEDDAVCTFHFLKLVAGDPSDAWVAGDFTAVESAFDTYWNAIKVNYNPVTVLKQFRWYRTGPQRDIELGAPGRTGPPVRVVDRSIAGTDSAAGPMPPQVAVSITEKTTSRKTWGRYYLPAPNQNVMTVAGKGRLTSTFQTTWGNAADTFYEACKAAGVPIVVYSPAKPERPTKGGGSLPAIGARALTVDELQLDDILDVVRSRRWSQPLLRLQRAVG